MSQNNWDIDELLNFDYSKQEADDGSKEVVKGRVARATMTSLEDSEAYAEVRKASSRAVSQQDSAEKRAAAVRAEREARAQEVARQRAEAHAQEIQRRRAEEQARIARAKQVPEERAKAEYAKLRAEAQAREQSRQQARREEYLRQQAEVEARERARQEALRQQAEEQARKEYLRQQALRQQAEAKAREEAEARMRAEARRQAEAKAREEAEAHMRAEARRQAEAKAREEAEAHMRAEARRQAEERLRAEYAQQQAEARARHQASGPKPSSAGTNGLELEDGLSGAVRTAPLELPEQESRAEVVARAAEKKAKEKAKITKTAILKNLTSSGSGNRGSSRLSAIAGSEGGFNKFARYLSVAYGIIAAVFAGVILYMDVLPTSYLIALAVIMVLLSAIVIRQLNKNKIKMWGRVFSTVLAIILIVVYGMGSVYALGTLSFLGSTSVKNDNRVASITKDSFNIVITGMDVNGTIDTEGRSDVNMVLTVNPTTGVILMTSIPRDYEIRMPDKDYATDKLTHTGFYGIDSTLQAEADLLDIKTNYYVKVNFTTVKVFINSIGGVDVYSDYEFRPVKRSWFLVKKGWNHMNGKEALAFARERKAFLEGDNQRVKNQQRVVEAILKKATDSKTMVLKYNQVMNDMKDYFEMSFSSREIRSLLKMQLARGTDWKVYKNTLEGFPANKATYTGGSQLLYVTEQNPESVANAQALIKAVMNGDKIKKNKDGTLQIEGASSDSTASEGE